MRSLVFATYYHEFETLSGAVQWYGDLPYEDHLIQVAAVMTHYGYTTALWQDAAHLHDVLEDTKCTFSRLEMIFGSECAKLVNAVSGFGATRKERNRLIYEKIMAYPVAAPLKVADRIANTRGSYMAMYAKEHADFMENVGRHAPDAMINELNRNLGLK